MEKKKRRKYSDLSLYYENIFEVGSLANISSWIMPKKKKAWSEPQGSPHFSS